MELDPFFLGFMDFFRVGRHFFAAAAIQHMDLGSSQAERRARRIHGHIAAAHHGHPLPQRERLAHVGGPQEITPAVHLPQILAGDVHLQALLRADRDKNGFVALLLQVLPA